MHAYCDRRQEGKHVCDYILQPNELKEKQHNGGQTDARGTFIKC